MRLTVDTLKTIPGFIPFMLVTSACFMIQMGADELGGLLRYERDGILDGQVWRLVTANFVHQNFNHLMLNIVPLFVILLLCNRAIISGALLVVIFAIGLGVTSGLLIFNPGIAWYTGLSGVLHGLFAYLLVTGHIHSIRLNYGLLALLIIKLIWEQCFGALPGGEEAIASRVVVDAHLYGAVSGGVIGMLFRY